MTSILEIECDPILEDCEITEFAYKRSKYVFQFLYIALSSTASAVVPMIFWYKKYKGSLADYLPNDHLWYTWMVMWIGSLIVWSFPGVYWPLTFINSRAVHSIFIAWLAYAVSNLTPVLYFAVTVLYLISYYDLIPKEATADLVAVTQKDVRVQLIVWSCSAFVNWLMLIFLGNDAIMFLQPDFFPEDENRGFLWPSIFT